jgi:hypothetical protein
LKLPIFIVFRQEAPMALIAALLVADADRTALVSGVAAHEVVWADTWIGLTRTVRQKPVAAAVADLHAEPRKDGVLRVFRFRERYPLTPLLVWGELDGRELYRLGKAGASEVIASRDAGSGPPGASWTCGESVSLRAKAENRNGQRASQNSGNRH